jgi:hypothetical protein
VRRHEVDDLGRDLFGGADEVAFVLAILVVHDDDHAAIAYVCGSFFNGGKRHFDLYSSTERFGEWFATAFMVTESRHFCDSQIYSKRDAPRETSRRTRGES